MLLPLDSIRRDGGTQPRFAINLEVASEYGDQMKAGVKFPPVTVFYDGSSYWLADGFHRAEGAFSVEIDQIECDVRQGTLEDAQWCSFSANRDHGLRRTNEDKQRAVKAALAHAKATGMSDGAIAKHVGVSQPMVSEWRTRIDPTHKLYESTRTGADGRNINTANIGKRPQTPDGGTRVEMGSPSPQPPVTPQPTPQCSSARDADSVATAVWTILDSESTPAEIAAYMRKTQTSINHLEDARDFLAKIIEEANRL